MFIILFNLQTLPGGSCYKLAILSNITDVPIGIVFTNTWGNGYGSMNDNIEILAMNL